MKRIPTLLLIAAAAPNAALAATTAGFDAHNFHLNAADGQPISPLEVPSPFITRGVFGAAVFEYAKTPLVRVPASSDGTMDWSKAEPMLDDVAALNLNLGWAPVRFARVDVGIPLFVASSGLDGAANGFTAGDLRVQATVGWSQEEQRGFGIAVQPFVAIPLGADAAFLGNSAISAGGDLALGYHTDKFIVAASAGYALEPDIQLDNLSGADHVNVGGMVGYEVVDNLGINAEVRAGLPLAANDWPGTETPAEIIAHAKYQLPFGLDFLLGGAGGLSYGAGTPAWRAFVGVGYGPVFDATPKAPPPPVDLDADDDGINDDVDQCKMEKETVNDWKDTDGCPDGIGNLTARSLVDGKSVPASITLSGPTGAQTGTASIKVDKAEPGSAWTAKATYKCYTGEGSATAKEGDTALDIAMKPSLDAKAAIEVVNKKGKPVDGATVKWDVQEGGGCVPGATPVALAGGKGEQAVGAGKHRVFITAKEMTNFSGEFEFTTGATTTIRVELDSTRIKLEEKQIVILDKVFFETNKDIIKPESFKLLDEVASVVMANPQVGRVEVSGHTDSDGDDASNLDLSQRRAESVKRYLEGKGVDPARLIAKGYGETKPIDSNKSSKGKANNRRVEFNLIDQASPTGPVEVTPGTPGATPAPTK